MGKRKYRTGTRWCIWRWTDVDSEYITRLHVLKTPWFAICLHWLNKPDPEPWLHDHPVSFLSLILRGGYSERRRVGKSPPVKRTHRWWNWITASPDDRHRITHVLPGTLTLCLMGPKTREWGFHTPEGWVHWKEYYAKQRATSSPSPPGPSCRSSRASPSPSPATPPASTGPSNPAPRTSRSPGA